MPYESIDSLPGRTAYDKIARVPSRLEELMRGDTVRLPGGLCQEGGEDAHVSAANLPQGGQVGALLKKALPWGDPLLHSLGFKQILSRLKVVLHRTTNRLAGTMIMTYLMLLALMARSWELEFFGVRFLQWRALLHASRPRKTGKRLRFFG